MNSLPITSRDVASGSTRENTRLEEELVVAGAGVDGVRALLERDELGDEAVVSGLTMTHRFASPRTSSG